MGLGVGRHTLLQVWIFLQVLHSDVGSLQLLCSHYCNFSRWPRNGEVIAHVFTVHDDIGTSIAFAEGYTYSRGRSLGVSKFSIELHGGSFLSIRGLYLAGTLEYLRK